MAKQLDFFDQASSSTVPTIGSLEASKLVQYASDAAYEAAEPGSPAEGNVYYNTTNNEIRFYDGAAWITLLDSNIDANQVSYNNVSSGLAATNVQDGIDETEGRLDDSETLSGSPGATDHGTFTGTTIPDSSTTKGALQSLETEVELKIDTADKDAANGVAALDGSAKLSPSVLPTSVMELKGFFDPGTATFTDAGGDNGDVYEATAAGSYDAGSGSITYAIGDWAVRVAGVFTKSLNNGQVASVNGAGGVVVLDTDDISEGVTNEYYTNAKADGRIAAASVDDLNDVDTSSVAPTDGQVMTWVNGNSNWEPKDAISNLPVTSESTNYTALTTDSVIFMDASGASRTIDLPTASGVAGKVYTIKKTDSSFNSVVIDPNSTETIDGSTTTTLNTQHEAINIVSDGTNWEILERKIPSETQTFTPTGSWVSGNETYTGTWRRSGDSLVQEVGIVLIGAPTAATLTVNLPSGLTIDTTKIEAAGNNRYLGTGSFRDSSASSGILGGVGYNNTTSIAVTYVFDSGTLERLTGVNQANPFLFASGDELYFRFTVPILGWKG